MGNTIKVNPIKCAAFNADFDGDSFFGRVNLLINGINIIKHISELENLEIEDDN